MVFRVFLFLILFPGFCWATHYESKVTNGNLNQSSSWTPSGVPGDGDTAKVRKGHTITVTASTTVGSRSGTKHGIEIEGKSPTSYGKLVVEDGVTLTLKGVDNLNSFAMKNGRWGVFELKPGAGLEVDCASNGQTGILNEGIISAIGTAAKKITFSVPDANRNWNVTKAETHFPVAGGWLYDQAASIACVELTSTRIPISNATGTKIGKFGDSSINGSFSQQTPASICQTEVPTLAEVTSAGKYFVDYHLGMIFFYHDYTAGNPSFHLTYKHLETGYANWKGWFIKSVANWTYNEGWFDYCVFEYMGGMTSVPIHYVSNKKSPSVEANRNFYIKNSTIRWSSGIANLSNITGSATDPILFDGNTIQNACTSYPGYYTCGFNLVSGKVDYLTLSNNVIDNPSFLVYGSGNGLTPWTDVGLKVLSNIGRVQSLLFDYNPMSHDFYDGLVSGNTIDGCGVSNTNNIMFGDVHSSSPDHPLVIQNNTLTHVGKAGALNRNVVFDRNFITYPYNGGLNAYIDGYFSENVTITNNIIIGYGAYGTPWTYRNAAINMSKESTLSKGWIDNWKVINNTVAINTAGGLQIGSRFAATVISRAYYANNLIYGGRYAVVRSTDSSTKITKAGFIELDFNSTYGQSLGTFSGINRFATFYKGGKKYNTLSSPSRNVTGVSLWNPHYTTPPASKSLKFTITTPGETETLEWGSPNSGNAVNLVQDYGTALYARNIVKGWGFSDSAYMFDPNKRWPMDRTNSSCPVGNFLKVTTGGNTDYRAITDVGYGAVSATVSNGGSGYAVNNVLQVKGGTVTFASPANAVVTSVGSGGAVTAVTFDPTVKSNVRSGAYSATPSNPASVTGGSGRGCTLSITWTVGSLFLVPEFANLPNNTSAYVIYKAEVQLLDTGGAEYVNAGIYPSQLPTSTQTDTGITMEYNKSITSDNKLVNPTGVIAEDFKIQATSPARDVGTTDNAPAQDYFGTSRPQGNGIDMGAHEYSDAGGGGIGVPDAECQIK
jgi:hypothetical protein